MPSKKQRAKKKKRTCRTNNIETLAENFHKLYWKGTKRPILDRFHKLQGEDKYILHVNLTGNQPIYCFIDENMVKQHDQDNFDSVSIDLPGLGEVRGMRNILYVAKQFNTVKKDMLSKFLFVIFDKQCNPKTNVIRTVAFWGDYH